jgi:polyisoprenoid-binding protein YceI
MSMNWKLAAVPFCAAAVMVYADSSRTSHAAAVTTQLIAVADATPGVPRRIRLVVAAEGNEARYRVREQLANIEFPSDAVGKTSAITGAIVIEDDGTVNKAESKIVIDLTTLRSDSQMRDRYIQRNTLQTEQFGKAEFVPTEIKGLRLPIPTQGAFAVQVIGDLTVHGVTKSTTWQVLVQATQEAYQGTARTEFTFGDFSMTQPRVARVLSVVDTIRLEYDFRLTPQAGN